MPRVHFTKKARRDYPENGIKKGESFYYWKFRHGPMMRSKTQPKPSQLTQSEFLGQLYAIEEELQGLAPDPDDVDSTKSTLEDIANRLRDLGQECSDKKDNMPDGLQESDTGQLLQTRADNCEAWADAIESAANDMPDRDDDEYWSDPGEGEEGDAEHDGKVFEEEAFTQAIQDQIDEASNANPGDWG